MGALWQFVVSSDEAAFHDGARWRAPNGMIVCEPHIRELAEMWVADYGANAPARIREWSRLPGQAPEIAEALEEVARVADQLLNETWTEAASGAAGNSAHRHSA
jgi:hypothetical protein